ncbi:acyl-CoA desaturase [Streptomyces sp. Ag109_G2-15]|uniref:acyl-CoA desaturase n=1 Tax=Streptomyces sp. Ag109_G2-15 TaxID=1938850 RepID=UPI000BD780E5|nr:acyl-CoA desaturase [Streptomyces sp. Ag109_G2-15]SOE06997.1 Delta-9 acyl-phospholipid desaturase [Streptomyces sp. Ag109_G2-15]
MSAAAEHPNGLRAPLPDTVPVSRATRTGSLLLIVAAPLVVLAAALPVALVEGWGPRWYDVLLGVGMYALSIMGITAGYHRHFTHLSFKAKRPLRIALGFAGGLAMEGPVTLWVAEHRRHHQYADRDGDPHSPWKYGTTRRALFKGLWHAQVGWFSSSTVRSNYPRYAPDLLADPDVRLLDRCYGATIAVSLALPPALVLVWTRDWRAAAVTFFWASLVRYAVVHHVTWSVNSIAHVFGPQHYATRDQSRDVHWVALLTFGEGWHNLHHADPNSARHGGLKGQPDLTAWLIARFERWGWAYDVRWPDERRMASRLLLEGAHMKIAPVAGRPFRPRS